MKRIILFITCLFLCTALISCQTFVNDSTTWTADQQTERAMHTGATENIVVQRGIDYGIIPEQLQGDWEAQITFTEFCQLLKRVVLHNDASKSDGWSDFAQIAEENEKTMVIGDIVAPVYYAASLLGFGDEPNGDWGGITNWGETTDWSWHRYISSFLIFRKAQEPSPFKDNTGDIEPAGWNYPSAGYFWCAGQFSPIDGEQVLFEEDDALMQPLSRERAIEIITHFYESIQRRSVSETSSDAVEILSRADVWLEDFDNYKNQSEYKGKIYYFSDNGDDNNNGRTPETAFASLSKIKKLKLKPGDAVLLECGSEWYGQTLGKGETWWDTALSVPEGVTVSSFGEGDHPILRGDIPGVSDRENWSLWYDQDGVRIWQYRIDLKDCPVIVLNYGAQWAEKRWPHWNGDDYINADGSLFDVKAALDYDLTFCSLLDISGQPLHVNGVDGLFTGPLYLRCDKGNPAEVFNSIAVPQLAEGIKINSEAQVEGLNICYYTVNGICMDGYGGEYGMVLRDCEISWCGGFLSEYQKILDLPNGALTPFGSGGAVQISGTETTATHNYIHDCGPMTFIISIHGEQPVTYTYENQLIENNLIERCGAPFHWADLAVMDNPQAKGFISNLNFEENIVLYSGMGWINAHISQADIEMPGFYSAVECGMRASENDGIYIINNVFYLAESALVFYTDTRWETDEGIDIKPPVFSGNTYAQYEFGWLGNWNGYLLPLTEDIIRNKFGDQSGEIVIIN